MDVTQTSRWGYEVISLLVPVAHRGIEDLRKQLSILLPESCCVLILESRPERPALDAEIPRFLRSLKGACPAARLSNCGQVELIQAQVNTTGHAHAQTRGSHLRSGHAQARRCHQPSSWGSHTQARSG